jgi:hypothetical protein
VPIVSEVKDMPAPVALGPVTINGVAVAVMLAVAAVVAAVWAVDDHFISRREFNVEMRMVSAQLKAINSHLGIASPPVPVVGADPPVEP